MRALLIIILAALVSAAAVTGQEISHRCYEMTLGDPFWRASETAPTPPDEPPLEASIRRGSMTRLRLDGDGDMQSAPEDLVVDLEAEEPFGSSDWMIFEGELRIWWGPAWYDRTFGGFRPESDGRWTGDLRRQTDVRVIPDPGEWRFAAELNPIGCPGIESQAPRQADLSFVDSVAFVTSTLEAVVSRAGQDGLEVSESMKIWWDTERSGLTLSPRLVDEIRGSFPGFEMFAGWSTVFACPDGGAPRYPFNRCPLKEPGFVVVLEGILETGAEEIEVPFGLYTPLGSSGWSAVFTREPSSMTWSFTRLVNRWVS